MFDFFTVLRPVYTQSHSELQQEENTNIPLITLTFGDYDYEIINGKIYMMSRPNMNHLKVSGSIGKILEKYFENGNCEVYNEPDVFFDEENNYIPDLVVICDSDKVEYEGIYGAPDLV